MKRDLYGEVSPRIVAELGRGAAPLVKDRSVTDYPKLRQSPRCPTCGGVKLKGCVLCWACYGQFGMRFGNPAAERMLACVEQRLI